MNDGELISKVNSSMYHQCQERGYATAVDVLMDVGYLTKEKYEDWRFGRVPFLEAVCMAGLSKLTLVRRTMRQYAQKNGLKPSATYYKQWGRKKERIPGYDSASLQQERQSGDRETVCYTFRGPCQDSGYKRKERSRTYKGR